MLRLKRLSKPIGLKEIMKQVEYKIHSDKYGEIVTLLDEETLNLIKTEKYTLRVKYDKTINNFYVYTGRMKNKKWEVKALHRIITDCPKGLVVDHINRNPLDNRLSNLRICTVKENNNNRKVRNDNKVGYSGISYNSKQNIYIVRITEGSKRKYIGRYNTKEEAINALKVVMSNA